jgi:endonuclease-3
MKKAPARPAAKKRTTKKVATRSKVAPRPAVPLPLLLERLQEAWPDAHCELDHRNAFELLIATILSAQCTDVRVNLTTPALFQRFPTAHAMSEAMPADLEALIKSTGFFRNKAKSILGASRRIVTEFGGKVPDTMEELLTLPGVARKTGSVVLGNAFGKAEGIAVDTHVMRLTQRWKITRHDDPKNIEQDLMKMLPRDRWTSFSHQTIFHGRRACFARKPDCANCMLKDLCPSAEA